MTGKDLRETVQAMRGLPWAARALYLYLATYGSPCWPSTVSLARELGTSESYIRQLISQLEAAGFIERTEHQGRKAYLIRHYSGAAITAPLSRRHDNGAMIAAENRRYSGATIAAPLLRRRDSGEEPPLSRRKTAAIAAQKIKERKKKIKETTTTGSSGAPNDDAEPTDLAAPGGAAAKPLPGPKSGKADKAGKAAKQESDEKPPLPIRLYRHYCKLNPNEIQARAILAEVSEGADDIRAWKQALEWSRMKGIDRADVAAILAAYRTIKSRAAGGDGTPAGRRYSYAEALDLWERRGRPGGVFPPADWKMITENGKAFFLVP